MELATERAYRHGESKDLTLPTSDEFEATVLENWSRIFAHLRRLVGDPAEAEDLALETFLKLYLRPPRDVDRSLVGGWLYRVATNLGLNALRGGKRRDIYEADAARLDPSQDADEFDPTVRIAQSDQIRRVRQTLSELRPKQAQLLLLRHSGLTYKELASALGVSPESIGSLLTRAEAEFERRWERGER